MRRCIAWSIVLALVAAPQQISAQTEVTPHDIRCATVLCSAPLDPPDDVVKPILDIKNDFDYISALRLYPEWFQMPEFMRKLPNYGEAPVSIFKQVKRVECNSSDADQLQIKCDPQTSYIRVVTLQISFGPLIRILLPGSWDNRQPGDDDLAEAKRTVRAGIRRLVYGAVVLVAGTSYVAYRLEKLFADRKITMECYDDFTERCRQHLEEDTRWI
jgi:hypothetical protein